MTLTLQDAQHVSWKIFRKISDKLNVGQGRSSDTSVTVSDLIEKAGKVAAIIRGLEGFEVIDKQKSRDVLSKELNGMLYVIFVLAEHYGINLEEKFLEQVNDYLLEFLS